MLGDRIASKSGVPAVVKTADGKEVLVKDALILDQQKPRTGRGLLMSLLSLFLLRHSNLKR